MRSKDRIVGNLESVYRSAFEEADKSGDQDRMARLDFDFQRDQLILEVLLDLRELLAASAAEEEEGSATLLERAKAIKDLTRLR